MAWLEPYVGLLAHLQELHDGILASALVGLYTEDHEPTIDDVAGDYTAIEAAWTGYARQAAYPWTSPVAVTDPPIVTMYSNLLVFPVESDPSPDVVYGYFVLDAGGVLIYAEQLPATITPILDVPISLVARFFLRNLP